MCFKSGAVFEISRVHQLVHLIRPDGREFQKALYIYQIGRARRDSRNARAREGYLARGAKLIDHIGAAGFFAFLDYIRYLRIVAVKGVDTVGIVPEDTEITSWSNLF